MFLMIILVALLRRVTSQQALLGMAMSAGGVFYAIATAPFFPKSSWWWVLPILSAQSAVFWVWARAAFDDDFVLRRWHGALWLSIVAFGFAITLGWAHWPALAGAGGRVLAMVALALALAAAVQTVKTWRADLVAASPAAAGDACDQCWAHRGRRWCRLRRNSRRGPGRAWQSPDRAWPVRGGHARRTGCFRHAAGRARRRHGGNRIQRTRAVPLVLPRDGSSSIRSCCGVSTI